MFPWDILPDFGVTPVIKLAWLTCSRVVRLIIAEVLISQKTESSLLLSDEFHCKELCLLCTLGTRYHGKLFLIQIVSAFL